MAQKVNPRAFRLGITTGWSSKWFAIRDYRERLQQDVRMRDYLRTELKESAVDRVEIERGPGTITVMVHSAKPGFIIGRGGQGAEELKKKVRHKFFPATKINLQINIVEVSKPSLSAAVVAQQIASDLEKRLPFRRAMKQSLERMQKAGAEGAKVMVKGRLNGAEIARREKLSFGKIPLQNLRADINYDQATAHTIYGAIGVTVWIYRGLVFGKKSEIK